MWQCRYFEMEVNPSVFCCNDESVGMLRFYAHCLLSFPWLFTYQCFFSVAYRWKLEIFIRSLIAFKSAADNSDTVTVLSRYLQKLFYIQCTCLMFDIILYGVCLCCIMCGVVIVAVCPSHNVLKSLNISSYIWPSNSTQYVQCVTVNWAVKYSWSNYVIEIIESDAR